MIETPLVCDIGNYIKRFDEIRSRAGFDRAKIALQEIIKADSYGTIVEKVISETDKKGLVFSREIIAKVQQTSIEHSYIEVINENGQYLMTCPENVELKVDIMENISPFRRGLDRKSMGMVKELFLKKNEENEDEIKEGEMIIWGSPIAESWEEKSVKYGCSEYGYLYAGRVIVEEGIKKLLVHDIRNDLPSTAYEYFYKGLEAEIYELNPDNNRPLLDKVMTQVLRLRNSLSDEEILKGLCKSKKEITGDETVFNLQIETLVKLQDLKLREQIRDEVAGNAARWITDQIAIGRDGDWIQAQVKNVYIEKTRNLLQGREKGGCQALLLVGDRTYENNPFGPDLVHYRVVEGKACGGWGGGSSIENSISKLLQSVGIEVGVNAGNETCSTCKIRSAVKGGCGYCEP